MLLHVCKLHLSLRHTWLLRLEHTTTDSLVLIFNDVVRPGILVIFVPFNDLYLMLVQLLLLYNVLVRGGPAGGLLHRWDRFTAAVLERRADLWIDVLDTASLASDSNLLLEIGSSRFRGARCRLLSAASCSGLLVLLLLFEEHGALLRLVSSRLYRSEGCLVRAGLR